MPEWGAFLFFQAGSGWKKYFPRHSTTYLVDCVYCMAGSGSIAASGKIIIDKAVDYSQFCKQQGCIVITIDKLTGRCGIKF
jgi:hypothetical protein